MVGEKKVMKERVINLKMSKKGEKKKDLREGRRAAFCAVRVCRSSGGNKGDFSRINCIIYLIYLEENGGARSATGEGVTSTASDKAVGLAVLCDAIPAVVAAQQAVLARRPSPPCLFIKRKYLKK